MKKKGKMNENRSNFSSRCKLFFYRLIGENIIIKREKGQVSFIYFIIINYKLRFFFFFEFKLII